MSFTKGYFGLTAILGLITIPLLIEPTITGMSIAVGSVESNIMTTFILLGVIGILGLELIIKKPIQDDVFHKRELKHIEEDIQRIHLRLNR